MRYEHTYIRISTDVVVTADKVVVTADRLVVTADRVGIHVVVKKRQGSCKSIVTADKVHTV